MSAGQVLVAATMLVFAAAFLAAVFVMTFWGQTIVARRRRRRAAQSPEEAWRDLLAGRVWAIPCLMLFAGWLLVVAISLTLAPRGPASFHVLLLISPFLQAVIAGAYAVGLAWRVSRDLALGWGNVQHTWLARRAHELVRHAADEAARRSVESASC